MEFSREGQGHHCGEMFLGINPLGSLLLESRCFANVVIGPNSVSAIFLSKAWPTVHKLDQGAVSGNR